MFEKKEKNLFLRRLTIALNGMNTLKNRLVDYLEHLLVEDAILAFSGGVDSTLLLKAACLASKKTGAALHAVTFKTRLHPMKDLEITKTITSELGVSHEIIEVDELEQGEIMNNPVDRCYLCKKYLFTQLRTYGKSINISLIMEGTNSDDLTCYRPGLKALKELDVKSPLAETGMTKLDVRKMAAEFNLSVADRPSSPCLATRFPYNTRLSYEQMQRVEEAEEYLQSLGFYNVRIRVHDNVARLEIDRIHFTRLLDHQEEVVHRLKHLGYTFVTLDLEGFRSGSMDYHLKD